MRTRRKVLFNYGAFGILMFTVNCHTSIYFVILKFELFNRIDFCGSIFIFSTLIVIYVYICNFQVSNKNGRGDRAALT